MKAVPGISLVYDALFVALTHTPAAGRRHLIVAMTDGQDCGSLLDGARVLDASARSEAVLHWIYVSSSGDFDPHSVSAWCTPERRRRSGFRGSERRPHRRRFASVPLRRPRGPHVRADPRRVPAELRAPLLPQGVPAAGWHAVTVQVPAQPALTIKARSGYFGAR